MKITQVLAVGVLFTDQDRAFAFYTRTPGLDEVRDPPWENASAGSRDPVRNDDDDRPDPGRNVGGPRGIARDGLSERWRTSPSGRAVSRATDAAATDAEMSASGADTDPEVLRLGLGIAPVLSRRSGGRCVSQRRLVDRDRGH